MENVRMFFFFFFSSRRRHTRSLRDWSSDVCSSDLDVAEDAVADGRRLHPGSGHSFAHHCSGKITRRNASEAATVFPNRGTGPGQNEKISVCAHHRLPHMSRPPLMAQIWPVM